MVNAATNIAKPAPLPSNCGVTRRGDSDINAATGYCAWSRMKNCFVDNIVDSSSGLERRPQPAFSICSLDAIIERIENMSSVEVQLMPLANRWWVVELIALPTACARLPNVNLRAIRTRHCYFRYDQRNRLGS